MHDTMMLRIHNGMKTYIIPKLTESILRHNTGQYCVDVLLYPLGNCIRLHRFVVNRKKMTSNSAGSVVSYIVDDLILLCETEGSWGTNMRSLKRNNQ